MPLTPYQQLNPLARLYALSGAEGVERHDGPSDLLVTGLRLGGLGGEPPSLLVRFLRAAAGRALTLCQLRLGGEVLGDYASEPFTNWLWWEVVEGPAGGPRPCENCLGDLLELREPFREYEANAGVSGEALADDALSALDLLRDCAACGGRITLDVRLEKEPLVRRYLLDTPQSGAGRAGGLVWFDPRSLEVAFDSFQDFLAFVGRRADRPLLFFFHEPLDAFEGYYFKALSLKTLASPEALAGTLAALTPGVVDEYRVLYKSHEQEKRPDPAVSERFNIPPSLFLRQAGEFAHYPLHPLFVGGPLRSLLLYSVLTWLAETTMREDDVTSFTLRSTEEGAHAVRVAFTMMDARVGGESVFKGDWGNTLAYLARDIGLSAGSEELRERWASALMELSSGRFTAPLLLNTLDAARRRFEELRKVPFEIVGPDVQLMILAEQWRREEKTETRAEGADEVKTETKTETREETEIRFYLTPINQGLGLPVGPVGEVRLRKGDEYVPLGELSEMAARHLKAVLKQDPRQSDLSVPDVERLKNRGRDLWDKAIPAKFKEIYAQLGGLQDLSLFIVSEERSFPWELVVPFEQKGSRLFPEGVEDPWLALKFVIGRWVIGLRPPANEIGMGRVCCVIAGQDLGSTKRESDYFEGLKPEARVDRPQTREQLLEWLGTRDYDVIHFACHGRFDEHDPGGSAVLLPDGSLMRPDDLYGGEGEKNISNAVGRNRPLVFLNACHTGRTGSTLFGVEGWANSFIRHGCGAFIGCGWEVADPLAAEFAVNFYGEFRRGRPLGRAVYEARRRIMRGNEGNSTWLAYYLYGNPECRFSRP